MRARSFGWLLAALLLAPAAAGAGQAPRPQGDTPSQARKAKNDGPRLWWVDPQDRAALGITDQQSADIQAIWQKSLPELRAGWQKLHGLEDTLDQMIRNSADEPAVKEQINHVEDTRADMNKARQLMLYRMNRVLTPDQRDKLKAMHDRRDPQHRGSDPR